MVNTIMNKTGAGMPNGFACAIMNSGGMPVIQAPPVIEINPPRRIDNMPNVMTIDGMRA